MSTALDGSLCPASTSTSLLQPSTFVRLTARVHLFRSSFYSHQLQVRGDPTFDTDPNGPIRRKHPRDLVLRIAVFGVKKNKVSLYEYYAGDTDVKDAKVRVDRTCPTSAFTQLSLALCSHDTPAPFVQ